MAILSICVNVGLCSLAAGGRAAGVPRAGFFVIGLGGFGASQSVAPRRHVLVSFVNKDLIPAIHVARVTDPVRPKPYGPVTRPTLR